MISPVICDWRARLYCRERLLIRPPAFSVAAFIATNSGLWFFHTLNPLWVSWVQWLTLAWLPLLMGHGLYIFVIADYSPNPLYPTESPDQGEV